MCEFEHWVDEGNKEWLEKRGLLRKDPEPRYEQVLGGGFMERRDYKNEQH